MDNFNILGQINYGKLKIYIHISVKFQMMLKYTTVHYSNKSTTAIKPQGSRIQDPITTKFQCKIIQNNSRT